MSASDDLIAAGFHNQDTLSVQENTFQRRKMEQYQKNVSQVKKGVRVEQQSVGEQSEAVSQVEIMAQDSRANMNQGSMYLNLAIDMGRSRASNYGGSQADQDDLGDKDGFMQEGPQGFTVVEAALSIISSIIGGGIISIPYAMTTNGLTMGAIIHLVIMFCLMFTTHFYLSAKAMFDVNSFSELCYVCFGRSSIYVINLLIAFVIFGILTLYMILFADISKSLLPGSFQTDQTNWLAWASQQKVTYIVIVVTFSINTMCKKSLTELKFQSRILFVGVLTLLSILFVKQFETRDHVIKIQETKEFNMEKFIDAINITLTSYGFIINLFPVASQMKEQSYNNVMSAVAIALCFCFSSYFILSYLAQNLFGSDIEVSLFNNMKNDNGILSVGVRVLFLIIFLCNIPYLFFPGKMSVLNALQEYRFGVFSEVLKANTKLRERELAEEAGDDYQSSVNISDNIDANPGQIDVINDCDDFTYYSVVFGFLGCIIMAALVINDLSLIFGMIAAFSESMLNFILPGLFFYSGLIELEIVSFPKKIGCSIFVFVGLTYFVQSNYYNYLKIMG